MDKTPEVQKQDIKHPVPKIPKEALHKSPDNNYNIPLESVKPGERWFLETSKEIMTQQKSLDNLQPPRPVLYRRNSSFSTDTSATSSQLTPKSELNSPFSEYPSFLRKSIEKYEQQQDELGISQLTQQQAEQFHTRVNEIQTKSIPYPTPELKRSVEQYHKEEAIKIINELTGYTVKQDKYRTWLDKPSGETNTVNQLEHLNDTTPHKETIKAFTIYIRKLLESKVY